MRTKGLGAAFGLAILTRAAALSPAEQQIVTNVDRDMLHFATDLEAAVRIDSATENLPGVRRMADAFSAPLTQIGFTTRFVTMPLAMARAGHLIAEHTGDRGTRLLLIGHLDTVLPGGKWRREGSRVYGSGVNDIKGGDLVIIYALRALAQSGALAGTRITVVMSGDEEAAGDPVETSRRDLLDAGKRSDAVLAFEADIAHTGTIARRGITSWRLVVQGATGHSSGVWGPAMGAGSIYETSRILTELYDRLRKLEGLTCNPGLIVGGTTAEMTRIGGEATGKHNVVPQRTMVSGDLRFISAEQLAEAQAIMRQTLQRHLPRTSGELTFGHDGYPAMAPTPASARLLGQLSQVSVDLGYGPITPVDSRSRGAGDIAFVSPPLPGVDGLGLRGGAAHAPGEWADLAAAPELVKRAAVLIYRLTRSAAPQTSAP